VASQPGAGPPPHVQHREDEAFYVLEGTTSDRTLRILARSFLYVPKGTLHVYKNVGEETGRMLVSRPPRAGMPASVVTPRCAACPTGCSTGLLVDRR
jgi:mannose-6-phosphate isomerase-like protein (cupin superfamily)